MTSVFLKKDSIFSKNGLPIHGAFQGVRSYYSFGATNAPVDLNNFDRAPETKNTELEPLTFYGYDWLTESVNEKKLYEFIGKFLSKTIINDILFPTQKFVVN